MSNPAPSSTPPQGPTPDPRAAEIQLAERQLVMLDRMAELGMELAEALQRRAIAEASTPVGAATDPANRPLNKEPGEIFVRVTRAVRLTLAMQMSLQKTIRILREASAAAPTPAAADAPADYDNDRGSFTKDEIYIKLMEMGCVPGELVTVEQKAPLGDPISISVLGYHLSLRLNEANSIFVEMQNKT